MKFIITCEHGGNSIPGRYRSFFLGAETALSSHRGYDPGALDLFSELRQVADHSFFLTVSRLLVETNRSLHHSQLFSEYSSKIPEDEKQKILEEVYFPYRKAIEAKIAQMIDTGEEVLHISVHTFTPELHGQVRTADIGLLYDPKRRAEKNVCREIKTFLRKQEPSLRVRYNYPYLGTADGFTTYLRKKFSTAYAGIELEVNQKHVQENKVTDPLKILITQAIQSSFS